MPPVDRKALAEFLGTFVVVLAGCGSLMVSDRFPGSIPSWAIPGVFGLAVALMIRTWGAVSGAHFNPAVSAAFAAIGRLPLRRMLSYWLAQVLGALVAIGLLALLLPHGAHYGATLPSVPLLQAFGWEAVLTFVLMLVILASTEPGSEGMSPAVAIGATVGLDALFGGPVTGASMNPARSFAPALAEGRLDLMWLYLLGPMTGAIAAALVYTLLAQRSEASLSRELT